MKGFCLLNSTVIILLTVFILPQVAFASGSITEFTDPLDKLVNTITGTAGKSIAIIIMAATGIYYILNKEDISGGFKLMLGLVFGISFIAFAGSIVNSVFSFSGAVISSEVGL